MKNESVRLVVAIDCLREGLAEPGIRPVIESIREAEAGPLKQFAAIAGASAGAIVAARRPLSIPHAVTAICVRFMESAAEINGVMNENGGPWGDTLNHAIQGARWQAEVAEFLQSIPIEPPLSGGEAAISSGFSLWQTHAAFALARAAGHYRELINYLEVAERWESVAALHDDQPLAEDWRIHAFSRSQAGYRALARGIAHIAAFLADRKTWRPFVEGDNLPDPRAWGTALRDMSRVVRVPVLIASSRVTRLTGAEPMFWMKEIRRGKQAAYSQTLLASLNDAPSYRACVDIQRLLEKRHQQQAEVAMAS